MTQNDIVNSFGIENILNSRIDELSDGFKKRVSLCLGFIIKPKILLIDEPYNFIDKNIKKVFDKEIKKLLENGSTFIFSDNNMENYGFEIIESVVL
jgi:ABC-type multidrug transport system ATPase subunit